MQVRHLVTMVQCQRTTRRHRARPLSSRTTRRRSNTLNEIFDRRNIAVGIDSSGQVVLARPDSVLAEVTNKRQRESLASYVERYDKEQAAAIRERGDGKGPPFETVRLDGRRARGDQRRGSLDVVAGPTGDRVSSPLSTRRSLPS